MRYPDILGEETNNIIPIANEKTKAEKGILSPPSETGSGLTVPRWAFRSLGHLNPRSCLTARRLLSSLPLRAFVAPSCLSLLSAWLFLMLSGPAASDPTWPLHYTFPSSGGGGTPDGSCPCEPQAQGRAAVPLGVPGDARSRLGPAAPRYFPGSCPGLHCPLRAEPKGKRRGESGSPSLRAQK